MTSAGAGPYTPVTAAHNIKSFIFIDRSCAYLHDLFSNLEFITCQGSTV